VVLDATLDAARLLDEGERHQRLLWALASVTAAVRKLSSWMSHEALSFELVFVRGKDTHALEAEQAIVSLMLREWQERGRLTLSTAESVKDAIARASDEHGARGDVVVVSTNALQNAQGRWRKAASVTVGSAPGLQFVSKAGAAVFDSGPAADRWAAMTKGLLSGLLG
jgi:hypothetical protein